MRPTPAPLARREAPPVNGAATKPTTKRPVPIREPVVPLTLAIEEFLCSLFNFSINELRREMTC